MFQLAEERCRSKVDHTVVEIIPAVAERGIAEVLKLATGDPLLRLLETHHSIEGVPFIVGRIHLVDHWIRFNVVRRCL